ncbi:hypothetical protein GOODEAATRI_033226 [Goodea atripinnis]|uniref:Cadherin domain-containing protein n=1 Tax=Goodea atripinnis TaxID=208336 RepID=A0ABV0PJ55_9TELE
MEFGFANFIWRLFWISRWCVGFLLFLNSIRHQVTGQIRYSIPEEMKIASIVGNLAQDLGLDLNRLRSGRARIVSGENNQYMELKTDKGILVVKERIDREQLCGDVTPCSLSFEIILENPIELHRVAIEILDINDNAPFFPNKHIQFETSESAAIGAKFPIEKAFGQRGTPQPRFKGNSCGRREPTEIWNR